MNKLIARIIVCGLILIELITLDFIFKTATELETNFLLAYIATGAIYCLLFFSNEWLLVRAIRFTPIIILIMLLGYYVIFPIIVNINDSVFTNQLLVFGLIDMFKVWFVRMTANQLR